MSCLASAWGLTSKYEVTRLTRVGERGSGKLGEKFMNSDFLVFAEALFRDHGIPHSASDLLRHQIDAQKRLWGEHGVD